MTTRCLGAVATNAMRYTSQLGFKSHRWTARLFEDSSDGFLAATISSMACPSTVQIAARKRFPTQPNMAAALNGCSREIDKEGPSLGADSLDLNK